MATVRRMILFAISLLSLQINAHLVYQCRRPYEADKSENDTFIYSEAEYRECGAFCVCKAFELACLVKNQQTEGSYEA